MSEQNLNSPDFRSSATSAAGAAAMVASAKGQSRWMRWLLYTLAIITVLVVGAGAIDKLVNINALPKCDGQRTRDTLSDLNKANKVNASAYNFIKQISATDNEIRCTANLALRSGGTLQYDYRIFKDDQGRIRVEVANFPKE